MKIGITRKTWIRTFVGSCRIAAAALLVLLLVPLAAQAQGSLGIGYTGMHDGQRGRVLVFNYRPDASHWDFSVGNISHTLNRDTSWVGVQYMIVDRDLFAGFGPALITRQTSTLTSQYQFITTFGWHHGHWALAVRHLSNGGTRGDNVGENLVTLAWQF
ncbi:MAG: acyloxyacyl hydrolase [Gammaproteobacteria bacterium]|nr:acyloxyacyl hydrolase [Gammaproteobacteria bacterium]